MSGAVPGSQRPAGPTFLAALAFGTPGALPPEAAALFGQAAGQGRAGPVLLAAPAAGSRHWWAIADAWDGWAFSGCLDSRRD